MATHMRAEPATTALDAAIVRRRRGTDLVHHSDHGSQYSSLAFGRCLRESGIAASMGSIGNCSENAMAESFFATLKTELIDRSDWATPAAAKAAVFEFIEVFYNRIRRHASLGRFSPEQFEERSVRLRPSRPVEATLSTEPEQLHATILAPTVTHRKA